MIPFSPQPFGKYFLVDRIATGGMAEIFKAKSYGRGGFENLLVIKRILPHVGANEDFVDMFVDEAKVSVALQHPNIVRVYDFGQILENYYIAMECVEGKDARNVLRKLAKTQRFLPVEFAAFIAHETCRGLYYAHTKVDAHGQPFGIVHRDISPSNVLCGYEGQVKIADFGIAKAASNAYQTRDGVLKGKFEYMSPEQAEGKPLDARSDQFAVGILLWEMLTGHRLFKTDNDIATLKKIQAVDVEPPTALRPDVPDQLEQIVMRALSADPDHRFPDAAAMADALRVVMAPEAPDVVGQRFSAWVMDLFAEEIAEERDRLEQNSAVAARLRAEAARTPGGSPGRHEADWEGGQTTSMKPASSRVLAPPSDAPRLWPVILLLLAMLAGTVGLAVAGVVVVVGLQGEAAGPSAAIDILVEPDARVYVDGTLRGTGSTLVVSRLEPGEHVLRLEAAGHEPVEERLVLSEGQALRYERVLHPLATPSDAVEQPVPSDTPDPGPRPVAAPSLVIDTTPSGATVTVDGVVVGRSPVTWRGRPDQEVRVRLEADGHTPVDATVRLGASGPTRLTRELPVADVPGSLTVLLVGGGWANVHVDGVALSKTAPLRDHPLGVGSHDVRVENPALGIDHTERVVVGSGASVTVRAAPR